MTDHFTADVRYATTSARLFDAIARPDRWWCTAGEVGEQLIRLDWSPDDFIAFRVEACERPSTIRWICVAQHDRNLPQPDEWVDTTLSFEIRDGGELHFEHLGLVPRLDCFDACAGGWDFFLRRSIRQLAETGRGLPYESSVPLAVARRYHEAWTGRRFAEAGELLARSVAIEVPVNEYAGADDFIQAVEGFGSMAARVELLSAHGGRDDAVLVYDMDVPGLGELRVAEHFEVRDGLITRLRQVHDTHAIRAAGLAG